MATRAADADVVRIVDAYMSTTAAVRARVLDYVDATWRNLGNYRDADIARFVSAVIPFVQAGQRTVASLTDAYLANVAREVLGEGRPIGVTNTDITGLRGPITSDEVYTRAGAVVWSALHDGHTLADAVEMGRKRASSIAATDVQLAKRKSAQLSMVGDKRVVGYRRVLEGAHNCGLCIVASTQRYHKGDLLPIHPSCDCGVLPIYGHADPGQTIDTESLAGVHAAIQERFGVSDAGARAPIDYRKVLLVQEHGELGPVLTVKGQHFTGPADIAA